MGLGLPEKLAALCRELDDPVFQDQARAGGGAHLLTRLRRVLRNGEDHPCLEADLDELNRLIEEVEGEGFYPGARRSYSPLPGGSATAGGARWWTCPTGRCSGFGLVRRGRPTPACAVTGDDLVARPLTS
ncbi:hypothetical protein [Streptosporangium sp. V21-05]|uniref:hypothetical protein n=1 Tax=Streptosporangium sp. V21-05 TaxID=3446115 RepID=UPI003F53D987